MENNKFFYTAEEYTANKCELADAFVALHFADGLSTEQRDAISHCLSLLNDFLEAMHDGKTFVYEQDDNQQIAS